MYSKRTIVVNKTGLHARPAAKLVSKAREFESKITISKLDSEGNTVKYGAVDSILNMMTMSLPCGTQIELSATGPDEKEAVLQLSALFDTGFGERE